jgi:AcrR family transcriptional regulator
MVSSPSRLYAIQWCITKESTSTGTVVKTLSEHQRSTNSRGYRKTKRAEDEQRTRARIVDAAEELHGTIGPARTSVSAVADKAGVTRATVYRHFPDDESLFFACSGQWLSRQRLPDPQAWPVPGEPRDTLRAGLDDIYRYYRSAQSMLTHVLRDFDVVPERVRSARMDSERRWRETLLGAVPGRRRAAVRAAVAHACEFGTWRSLALDNGLSDRAAVDLMVGMVMTAATPLPSS